MEDPSTGGVKDLVIVGGGPAGTAAALEARRHGLAVSIWERDRFPRHKVCGEFLSAESLAALAEEISLATYQPAVIRQSEFISRRGRVHGFRLTHPALGLSRHTLDEALWRAAASRGAEIHEGDAVRHAERISEDNGLSTHWELCSMNGRKDRGRALMISAGRWWSVGGISGPAKDPADRRGSWVGVKAHFAWLSRRDAVEMYYFPGGYCGLAPIEGGRYNACCLIHRSLFGDNSARAIGDFAAWISRVSRHVVLKERLREGSQVSKTLSTAPVEPARRRAHFQGVLMAGDSAGFLDPFTGDGVSIALQSGRLAARVLAGCLKNRSVAGGTAQAAEVYRRKLDEAVGGSYRLAGILRALVRAPSWLQESVAASLPWLGAWLEAETRWRKPASNREGRSPIARIGSSGAEFSRETAGVFREKNNLERESL